MNGSFLFDASGKNRWMEASETGFCKGRGIIGQGIEENKSSHHSRYSRRPRIPFLGPYIQSRTWRRRPLLSCPYPNPTPDKCNYARSESISYATIGIGGVWIAPLRILSTTSSCALRCMLHEPPAMFVT